MSTESESWCNHDAVAVVDGVCECGETRPTLVEEAERLLSYWGIHGDNPKAVAQWAIGDMLGILRFIVEGEN